MKLFFTLALMVFSISAFAEPNAEIHKKPLVERYVLDEVRDLRIENQKLRIELNEKITSARIENNDKAIEYATNTLTNIFYIVTVAASLFVILGWRSVSDIKNNIDSAVNKKIDHITQKYEDRLSQMEQKIKSRSEEIIANQEEISITNVVHSLWMRAGLEKSNREKVKLYDQILELKNNDIEALTYKADTLLDLEQTALALELTNQAIEIDSTYALAYWQRACARAELNIFDEALADIRTAISISNPLQDKIADETHFHKLVEMEEFKQLIHMT